MREARRLVSVFQIGAHPITGTTNRGFERENLFEEWGTLSGDIPTTKDFGSRRMVEKGAHRNFLVLSSPNGGGLMGASHRFLYVHISVVTVVSHRHHFGCDFEP